MASTLKELVNWAPESWKLAVELDDTTTLAFVGTAGSDISSLWEYAGEMTVEASDEVAMVDPSIVLLLFCRP